MSVYRGININRNIPDYALELSKVPSPPKKPDVKTVVEIDPLQQDDTSDIDLIQASGVGFLAFQLSVAINNRAWRKTNELSA